MNASFDVSADIIVGKALLTDALSALNVLNHEIAVTIAKDGITSIVTDPAHVAMARLVLPPGAFTKYCPSEEGYIGIDLDKLLPFIKTCRDKDVSIRIAQGKLHVKCGNLSKHIATIDTEHISRGKVPKLAFDSMFAITPDMLSALLRSADFTDHVSIALSDDGLSIKAEGDTDEVSLDIRDADLMERKGGDAKAMYPLDYLTNIVKPIPNGIRTAFEFSTDAPIRISYELEVPMSCSAPEHPIVTTYIAPRIESRD